MNFIPKSLLKKLYTRGSLVKHTDGLSFNIKNRLMDVQIKELLQLEIDGENIPMDLVSIDLGQGSVKVKDGINDEGFALKLGESFMMHVNKPLNGQAKLDVGFKFNTAPFGKLSFDITDSINQETEERENRIPRIMDNDYSDEAMKLRRHFVEEITKVNTQAFYEEPKDKSVFKGNIEHLTGFAQVPMGIAGPIKVNGEYADGEYLIPLATTEGTLVASYNKGIKLINEVGGVSCQIISDSMQRAPVFIFDNIRTAAQFASWVKTTDAEFKEFAESTSNHLKYLHTEVYQTGRNVFLRFNFFTGDAAGQNMSNKAAFAICQWILETFKGISNFFLESNMATDKKHSFINSLHSRGKRAIAEVTVPNDLLIKHFGIEAKQLQNHARVAGLGSMMAGVSNNGLHSANAMAALFIALGQDVANLAEGTSAFLNCDVLENGDLHASITLPSLIVGTVGGGTGLPTQKTCLQMLDCYGTGKAKKLAEIIVGVVLAGELSLASAISSLDWVAAHENYGKNR